MPIIEISSLKYATITPESRWKLFDMTMENSVPFVIAFVSIENTINQVIILSFEEMKWTWFVNSQCSIETYYMKNETKRNEKKKRKSNDWCWSIKKTCSNQNNHQLAWNWNKALNIFFFSSKYNKLKTAMRRNVLNEQFNHMSCNYTRHSHPYIIGVLINILSKIKQTQY